MRQPPGAPSPKKSRGVPPTDESDAASKTKGEGGKDKVSHDPFERFGVRCIAHGVTCHVLMTTSTGC